MLSREKVPVVKQLPSSPFGDLRGPDLVFNLIDFLCLSTSRIPPLSDPILHEGQDSLRLQACGSGIFQIFNGITRYVQLILDVADIPP